MALPVHNPIIFPPALANYENGKLPDGLLWSTPGQARGPVIRLTEAAARSWRAMTAAAKTAGHILKATSSADSYRSYAQQEATFTARYEPDNFPGSIGSRYWPGHYNLRGQWVAGHMWYQKPNTAVAAVPGTSNHGWGLAVDIGEERDGDAGTESIDTASLNWLIANAHLYGWSAEIQSEPWHWRRYSGDALEPAVLAYEATTPPTPAPTPGDDDDMVQMLVREGALGPIWLCDGFWRRRVEQAWLDPNLTGPITNHRAHLPQLLGNLRTGPPGSGKPGDWEGTGQIFIAGETGPDMDIWGIEVPAPVEGGPAPGGPVDLTPAAVDQVVDGVNTVINGTTLNTGR